MINESNKTISVEELDFSNTLQVAELFLETVTDPVARAILFNTKVSQQPTASSVSTYIRNYGIIKVMRSVVNLAYTIVLTRWRYLDEQENWGEPEDIRDFKEARYSKLFKSALGNEDITLDLQIFSLIELWVGLKKASNLVNGRFGLIFNQAIEGNDIGLTLQKVRDFIRNASFKRMDAKSKYSTAACNELCYKLIDAFMIFRAVKISYPEDARLDDKNDFAIEYDLNPKEHKCLYPNSFREDSFIVTQDQLRRLQARQEGRDDTIDPAPKISLFMLVETSAFDEKIQHIYRSFDGESEARIKSCETKEKAKKEDLDVEDNEIRETRKFLTFNYKNLRDFALVISDALKNMSDKKRELFAICKQRYPMIVANAPTSDMPDIYWDNIIILMLVEMGFSDFLERILDNENVFNSIMKNIGWRYNGRENNNRLKQYRQEIAEIESDTKQSKKVLNRRRVDIRVRKVLQAMGLLGDDEIVGQNIFEESLSAKYDNMCAALNVLRQYKEDKINHNECNAAKTMLRNFFLNIFRFLQVFYEGLDEYSVRKQVLMEEKSADETMQNDGSPANRQYGKTAKDLENKKIIDRRVECRAEFEKKAEKHFEKIKGQNLTQVYEGFCELCEQYNNSASSSFNISDRAKNLKLLITRNYICDVTKLREYATITFSDGKTKSNIFEMLENFDERYYSDPEYINWLDYFKDFFLFLIYNDDYYKRGLHSLNDGKILEKDCDPIYPYVVSYYRENVDRDQLKKCSYRVPIPTNDSSELSGEGIVVTLLTEENYRQDTYFCIPLRYGSSERWWINPFLIRTTVLDEIAKKIHKKEPGVYIYK